MDRRTRARHRAQEAGIHAFQHQRPVDRGQRNQRDAGDAREQEQSRVVKRQHGAEQDVQEIDVGAAQRDQHHAQCEREQVECCERRVLLQRGETRNETGQHGDGDPRDKAADRHGRQRQPGHQIAHRRARQDGVRHGVAGEAEAAQHQEDADRGGADRQCEGADERPLHESEFGEGADEEIVDHVHPSSRTRGARSGIAVRIGGRSRIIAMRFPGALAPALTRPRGRRHARRGRRPRSCAAL